MDTIRADEIYKSVDVFNASTVKPIDKSTIKMATEEYKNILTAEDNMLMGGFGSAVLEELENIGYDTRRMKRLGYPDKYIPHGSVTTLHAIAGIDVESITNTLKKILADG